VEIVEEPAEFTVSVLKARPSLFDSQFSAAQQAALKSIQQSVNTRKFAGMLLHASERASPSCIRRCPARNVLSSGIASSAVMPVW